MDPGVRKGICKAERLPGQSTSVVQARVRYPAPPILHDYRESDQLSPITGARPGAEADLLRQQGVARARGEIPGLRKSSFGNSILRAKTLPLLPELHRDSNDGPPNSQGPAKVRCGRHNDTMGGRTV